MTIPARLHPEDIDELAERVVEKLEERRRRGRKPRHQPAEPSPEATARVLGYARRMGFAVRDPK